MPRIRKHLFIVLIIILPFLLAEIYCRWMLPEVDIQQLTGKTPTDITRNWGINDAFSAFAGKKGYTFHNRDKNFHKTINKSGFISTPNLPVIKPPQTIRIVFLGESSTAGTGYNLSDKDTWPWQTVEMIKKELPGIKIDFINAALPGYTTFESFGRLWSRIRFFDPDIICVCHGWNDMYYFRSSSNETLFGWRNDQKGKGWNFNAPKITAVIAPRPGDDIIRHSQLLSRLRLTLAHKKKGELAQTPSNPRQLNTTYDKRGLDVFRTNLKLIHLTAGILGAKLFVCKQATLIVPGLSNEDRKLCQYGFHGFDHAAHVDAFENIYQVIDQEIPADSIIDTTPLSGKREYFADHIHPTKEGATKIAEIVSKRIVTWLSPNKN